jgi:hypothetical protein
LSRKPKNLNGSPKRKSNKSDAEKPETRLAPIRKSGGVRNRKNGVDEFGNPPPLPPMPSSGSKKPPGSAALNELDPVAESPTESLEES